MAPPNQIQITIPADNVDDINQGNTSVDPRAFDYSTTAEWYRAAVLGANDGFVSIASLMMGVGSVGDEGKAMILTFIAGLFASACTMAIGEFVSLLDIHIAHMNKRSTDFNDVAEDRLFNRFQATLASALVFLSGAFAPLIAAAFMANYSVGLVVVVAATTTGLVALGGIATVLGAPRVGLRCARMAVGGWMAMAITFGVTQLVRSSGLEM